LIVPPVDRVLSGSRVQLVPLGPAHLSRTRAWTNDPEMMRLMDRAQPVSEAEHGAWFASLGGREDCAYFAIEACDGGGHVGNVWLWAIDSRHRKAELRVVVGEAAARRRGFGAEAIDLACRHGFECLHLHRIYAYVLAINPGARRAFERAGFVLEGTLADDRLTGGGFTDAYLLARLAKRAT
jgi:RimJ/RimL family protein N-acetyltransferase